MIFTDRECPLATYAIGDIHGRSDLVAQLLEQIEVTPDDHVIFLGDYIDRGMDSKGVVDRLLEFESTSAAQVSFVMGNHEQWMLRSFDDHTRHSWYVAMNGYATVRSYSRKAAAVIDEALDVAGESIFDGVALPYDALVDAMPAEHLAFFRRLKPYVRTDDVVGVHAGVSADCMRVEEEDRDFLLWGREDWWDEYSGPDRIVYGHWGNGLVHRGAVRPFVVGRTYGIDCAAAGALMALRFPDLAVTSVQ